MPDPDSDGIQVAETFEFSDDGDPTTAALPFVEDELVVQNLPGADAQAMLDAFNEVDAVIVSELSDLDMTVLRIAAGTQEAVAAKLNASELFEAIHKNYVLEAEATPSDPSFNVQSYLTQIGAPQAWDITTGSQSVVIAVVDSGIESTHPDLSSKILRGWNVRTNTNDFRDVKGHGTLVAGVAGAMSNNAVGISGVTWSSPILGVRVSDDSGQATARDVTAGILWAVNNGAKVINVSFAPLWSNSLVKSAVELAFNRGAIVVISAGNGGSVQTATGYEQALFVGAIDSSNLITNFSDRGPFVDLVAPGKSIYTTAIGATYRPADGTSFAAPVVAGVAALAWSTNTDLRPTTIQSILLSTTTDLGAAGYDATYAGGAVNAMRAVSMAEATTESPDVTAPTVRITSPRDGGSVSGKVKVDVTATDAVGVADAALSIDGVVFATDNRSPYQFVVDTSTFSAGGHKLSVRATDLVGNVSSEASANVTFTRSAGASAGAGATTIAFRSPAGGASVSGDVLIEASVSDSDGLAVVEWWIDGASVQTVTASGTSTGVSYLWRGSGVTVGSHTIMLQVIDARGNRQSANLSLVRR